jgi:hypothetical protein
MSAVAGYLGGVAYVLNFDEVAPGIGLAAVEKSPYAVGPA